MCNGQLLLRPLLLTLLLLLLHSTSSSRAVPCWLCITVGQRHNRRTVALDGAWEQLA